MRRRALLVLIACLVALAPACGDGREPRNDLRNAIRDTERRATSFVYEERSSDGNVRVKGLIEDDFRYSAQYAVGNQPVMEQVVSDDALAVRMLQPRLLTQMIEDPEAATAETALEGTTVAEVLASRRWVVDPVGAPPTTTDADDLDVTGEDPVRDARIVLAYVERAMGSAWDISLYNPDSLSYDASEDPFPTPEDGSSVRRYDLMAPFVPGPDAGAQPGGAGLPGLPHLRKMSVYVEDGLVIRVAERIAAEGKQGDRLEFFLEETLRRADPDQAEQFERAVNGMDESERSDFLIGVLNEILELSGEDPVRPREMTIDFVDVRESEVEVPSDAVEASLALFRPSETEDGDTGSGVAAGAGAGAGGGAAVGADGDAGAGIAPAPAEVTTTTTAAG